MVKVLMVAGQMNYGGLETMLMGFLRNIDSNKVHIDFMLNYEKPGVFDDEIRSIGSRIFIMPRLKPQNLFKYIKAVNAFFKEHKGEYDAVHGNLTSVGVIYLTLARKFGVKTRIIHAHYSNVKGNKYSFLERLMLKPLKYCATHFFACSDAAGRFCFGEKITKQPNYTIIKNGVDLSRFSFNENIRGGIRKEMKLEHDYVILHVGRFELEKNHTFLLKVMSEYIKRDAQAVLLLAGTGSLKAEIEDEANKLNINSKVRFLGVRDDIDMLMQAADIFVLPSLHEGLPVSGIEAQAAGLKCLFSDAVTKEADITGNCEFLPISQEDGGKWVYALAEAKNSKRVKTDEIITQNGYSISCQAKWLENFYLKMSSRR